MSYFLSLQIGRMVPHWMLSVLLFHLLLIFLPQMQCRTSLPIRRFLSPCRYIIAVRRPTCLQRQSHLPLLPVALRKGTRSSTAHPISNFVSYDSLHPMFCTFAQSISSESLPRDYQEALLHPKWKAAMDEEIAALSDRGTWELVTRPAGATVVTCRWVYTVKYRVDDTIDRYKAKLVARSFTHTYGVDYAETFSPVARLNSIRVLLSIAINNSWELCQLDVKNAFLYGRFCTYGATSRVCCLEGG